MVSGTCANGSLVLASDASFVPYALELDEVSKSFGNVAALNRVSLRVRPGSVHALLGENGAGKTTLMRIAFGMIAHDSGTVRINGRATRLSSPRDAIRAGIGMVHQQFSLVAEMTVAENVALGGTGKYEQKEITARVLEIAGRLGMRLDPAAKVKTLTASDRQKLEIVRTFARDVRTLILDEPTAVLTLQDVGDLFAQLRSIADSGGSVVLITHKLQDALAHCDAVTVLRKGQHVLNAAITDVDESMLADAMLGTAREATPVASPLRKVKGKTVLILDHVSVRSAEGVEVLSDISLEVRAGEILGVAALDGAARPLLRLMASRLRPTTGGVELPRSVGFVPEDRVHDAVIPEFSLTENVALRNLSHRTGRMNWSDLGKLTSGIIKEYDVRTSGSRVCVSDLSGGNQQKFVLGRELSDEPELLVLENPTQGLDVHATASIHRKILGARDSGTAIVIYSSDLDELAELSDRVVVVNQKGITTSAVARNAIGKALLSRNV